MIGAASLPASTDVAVLASSAEAVEEAVLAGAIDAIGSDGKIRREFLALPFGNPFYGRDGRGPWILRDKAHAEQVIAASKSHLGGCEMMVDYDHQSALAAVEGVGGRAAASGWVKQLTAGEDGIHVTVDWTPAAEAALAAREYRYVSPNFRVSKDTREVTRLVNIGLTNSPNLELPALAAEDPRVSAEEKPGMKMIALATLASALALAATATEAEVLAAIGSLKTTGDADKTRAEAAETVLASTRTALGLADDAATDVVLAAVASAKAGGAPDPAKFVPRAGYDELAGRLKVIEEERILAQVDQAVTEGKVPPAMKDWAISLGKKDATELASYLASAVPFAGQAPQLMGEPKRQVTQLTEDEIIACEMTGMSREDFLKARNEETV